MSRKRTAARGLLPAALQSARARSGWNRTSPPPGLNGDTVPMMVRFSWPVKGSGWACKVRHAGPAANSGAPAPTVSRMPSSRISVRATGRHSGNPLVSTTVRSWVESRRGFVGGAVPGRRRCQPRARLRAARSGIRERGGGSLGSVPRARRIPEVAPRPPSQMQRRDLDPDARVVPRHAAQREAGLALGDGGQLLRAEAHVAIGVRLEVGIAHRGQALDEHHGGAVEAGPDGVGEQQAHPRVAARPLRFGGVGEPRRHVEALPAGVDIRRGRDGDGPAGAGEAGVLRRHRAAEHLDHLVGPDGGIRGARRWG